MFNPFHSVRSFSTGLLLKIKGFPKKIKTLPKKIWIPAICILCLICIGAVSLSIHLHNQYWYTPTTIEGIDISHYQGNINWKATQQNSKIQFAYIKATEGSYNVDPYFKKNLKNASSVGLKVGAYHFFTLSSSGADQAEHFIKTVNKQKGMLPPVADIETEGTQEEDFKQQVSAYIKRVQAYYGQKPVFYVPASIYTVLHDSYPDYPFWVINIKAEPTISGWTFWQYSHSSTIKGIKGKVDRNRYRGTQASFSNLLS